MMNISELPVDCISHILSLTSPKDVVRSSVVSKQFLSASMPDFVWGNFLPSDCKDIISRSCSLIIYDHFASKKDLFLYLSIYHILLDNSTKSYALDKWSGKICYMLGARTLTIEWGNTPKYWCWETVPESRFPECAVLKEVCWLDIKGTISTALLSPGTSYGAYFVFKIKHDVRHTGFGEMPVKVSVSEVGEDGLPTNDNHATEVEYYLEPPTAEHLQIWMDGFLGYPVIELPVVRDDGWMEIEMGRYQVGVNDGGEMAVLEMTLKEVEILYWKKGLVVHGIDIRPLS